MRLPWRKVAPTTNHNSQQDPPGTKASPPPLPKSREKLLPKCKRWKHTPSTQRLQDSLKPIKQIPLTWLGALGAVTLFVLTVQYAMTATLGKGASWSQSMQSRSILLLRILSEATSLLLAAAIASSFERLQWMLVSRKSGLSLPTILAVQSGTGVLGMLALTKGFGWGTRLFSLARLCLKLIVPVLAVLIMSEVTTELTSEPQTTFPVAAGIAHFEPSYAEDYSLIAGIYFATDLTSFLSNPQRVFAVDPIQRPTTPCTLNDSQKRSKACSAAYFVPGGLELITPWPSKNEDNWSAEVYVVDELQGYQLDFGQMSTDATFDGTRDCAVFGSSDGGIQICISSSDDNTLNAKLAHCPLDISSASACTTNTTWHASSGWSTSLRPYLRQATTSFSRTNTSILNISPSTHSAPQAAHIPPEDLLAVYTASFNTSGTPNSGTGSATQFIQYLTTVLSFAETSSVTYDAAGTYFRNLLALPLYYFHANNLAPDILPSPDAPLPGLPRELYTTAALAKPSYRIVVGRTTVIVYIAVSGVILLLCLGVLVAGSLSTTAGRCPETTYWPVVDFVANCASRDGGGGAEAEGEGLMERLKGCCGLGNGKELKGRVDVDVVLDCAKKG